MQPSFALVSTLLTFALPFLGLASLAFLWGTVTSDLEKGEKNEKILASGFTAISFFLLGLTALGMLILIRLDDIHTVILSR